MGGAAAALMPMGKDLAASINTKLNIRHKDFGPQLKSGDRTIAAALKQIARLGHEDYNAWRAVGCTVSSGIHHTRSIDAYLNTHKDDEMVKTCGKLAIVQTILERERGCAVYVPDNSADQFKNSTKVREPWLPDFLFILQDRIVKSESLDDVFQNLCIINFIYDRCVEQFLCFALSHLYRIDKNRASKLMQSLKIFHPYGQVGYMPWENNAQKRNVDFRVSDYGDLLRLAEHIRTFDEQIEDGIELQILREIVASASRLIFLGFHFHRQYMQLMAASPPGRGGIVNVYATALGRSEPDQVLIDKQIRKMLHARGGTWNVSIERAADCKKLFKDYGATWIS